jgi:hypothetical protein
LLSGCVSLVCYLNAILKMDVLTWGKTRSVEALEGGQLKQLVLDLERGMAEEEKEEEEEEEEEKEKVAGEKVEEEKEVLTTKVSIKYVDTPIDLQKKDLGHVVRHSYV